MTSRGVPGGRVEDLSDADLAEYIQYWRDRGDKCRRETARLADADPIRERIARDGYWCSVKESAGLAEQKKRRERTENKE